jgi:predicted ribosomally synthesized peptide with SipW-like signal peptide
MSRKLLLSSISIAAAASLIGVGAYAKFSDSEVSTTHKVTAGTLDLALNIADPYPEYQIPFDVTNAQPGETSKGHTPNLTKYVHMYNVGNLPGKLSVKVVMDSNDENLVKEPEPAWDNAAAGELGANLLVSIDGIGAMIDQPLTTLDAMAPVFWGTLAPGGDGWVSIDWSIPSSVGNEIMSDSASFHLEFTFEQV